MIRLVLDHSRALSAFLDPLCPRVIQLSIEYVTDYTLGDAD